MNFKKFTDAVYNQTKKMIKEEYVLFNTEVDSSVLWELYLNSFSEEENPLFRERTQHDCNACKTFFKYAGNLVGIDKSLKRVTVWDIEEDGVNETYIRIARKLSKIVKKSQITYKFLHFSKKVSIKNNIELINNTTFTFNHFHMDVPKQLVCSKEILNTKRNNFTSAFKNIKKDMNISLETIDIVLELITQGSLYRGDEFKPTIQSLRDLKLFYQKTKNNLKRNDYLAYAAAFNEGKKAISNTAIGTLLLDIESGMDLEEAVKRFENVVAPQNYKRPKPIVTKRMLEDAKKKLTELNVIDSLQRRFATIDDIDVNDILFIDRKENKVNTDIFDELEKETIHSKNLKFDKVEEVTIDKFINDIVPKAKEIELFLENKHENNLMFISTAENSESKPLFKWDNNFAWGYNGDVADSIKENVKAKGGNVDGVLRFSIQWNENDDNFCDLDAHCIEPNGNLIYYGNKSSRFSCGKLDIDIINPNGVAVENIYFKEKNLMPAGDYKFVVHVYSRRQHSSGFKAQIEMDGKIYNYEYNNTLREGQKIHIATIHFDGKEFKFVEENLKGDLLSNSKEMWNIKSNKFHKVNLITLSPNYWQGKEIGNKHFFFILDECRTDEEQRGIFNEFLKEEFKPYRRFFELLGDKSKIQPTEKQLAGLGFSSTVNNEFIVKVTGSFTRTLKVKIK